VSIQLIKASWPVPDNIHAMTTTRSGGVSKPPFDGFNLAHHVGDDSEAVNRNRTLLQQTTGMPSAPCWLNQTHSTRVIKASDANRGADADGSYTDKPDRVCAVMTADCLPVLLYNSASGMVAALHAGWRGLVSGIIEEGVRLAGAKGCVAWLGPAIGADKFEVGKDVLDQFVNKNSEHQNAFRQSGDVKWLADIYALARQVLQASGVSDVYGGEYCTVTDEDRFYSYRRDRTTGRMATIIWKSGN